jgi:hypothetical protein
MACSSSNAGQSGQWRTSPFKALLRQWWRVVHAPTVNYNADALRNLSGSTCCALARGSRSSGCARHKQRDVLELVGQDLIATDYDVRAVRRANGL